MSLSFSRCLWFIHANFLSYWRDFDRGTASHFVWFVRFIQICVSFFFLFYAVAGVNTEDCDGVFSLCCLSVGWGRKTSLTNNWHGSFHTGNILSVLGDTTDRLRSFRSFHNEWISLSRPSKEQLVHLNGRCTCGSVFWLLCIHCTRCVFDFLPRQLLSTLNHSPSWALISNVSRAFQQPLVIWEIAFFLTAHWQICHA